MVGDAIIVRGMGGERWWGPGDNGSGSSTVPCSELMGERKESTVVLDGGWQVGAISSEFKIPNLIQTWFAPKLTFLGLIFFNKNTER
jgi:hypothetical protein